MIELLKLCGFSAQEIDAELPRVEKAFKKLGITDEDIEIGKQRLAKYFDVEFKGVRKALRLCVMEFVNGVVAKEAGKKKVLAGFMAPGLDVVGSAAVSKSGEVFSAHHSWAFLLVASRIFAKAVPVLEAAERKWLKAGAVAHCANVKSFLGEFALDLVSKPDLIITSGYACETAPKTLDLLHEFFNIPLCCYDTCQDMDLSEDRYATKRAVDLSAKSIRKLVERIQDIVDFEITDKMLWEVINARGKMRIASGKVRKLVESSDPLPVSSTNDALWACLNTLTMSIEETDEAVDAINIFYEELQERVANGQGVVEKGAPRVLTYCPPNYPDPTPEYIIAQSGIAVVATSFGTSLPEEKLYPLPKTGLKDPYEAMALGRQRTASNQNLRQRNRMIIEECKRLNVDGVLDRYHIGCRALAGDALLLEEAVKKELGIPVLLMEWENFDPRMYKQGGFERRLDVFKSMMTRKSG